MTPAETDEAARKAFGRAIVIRRAVLGLTRKQLAARAQLSYPYVSEIEVGSKEPSMKAFRHIADALEMSVVELHLMHQKVGDGQFHF